MGIAKTRAGPRWANCDALEAALDLIDESHPESHPGDTDRRNSAAANA